MQKQVTNRKKGIFYLILATFFHALMSSCVRLAGDLPGTQKAFFRVLIMMLYSLALFMKKGEPFYIEKKQRKPLILRGLFGIAAILLNFYAVDRMNLADANMLNKLSPFFMVFFSWLLLKEAFGFRDVIALLFAFFGTLLIVKPGGGMPILPALAGALSGIGSGIGNTYVRDAAQKGASKERVVLVYSAIAVLVCLPIVLRDYHPMTPRQVLALLACGLCSGIGHSLNVVAYANAPAHDISVFEYSQVLFAAFLGFAMFGQIPDWLSILGYIVIIGTGVVVFLKEREEEKHAHG